MKTREVFWHLPTGLEALWYVLAVASVLVFAYGVARPIAKYRRGRAGAQLPPARELPGRLGAALGELFAHAQIARRDRYAGVAHAGIFYGFLVLFAGTVVLGIDTDIVKPIFGVSYFKGAFYLGYSVILDVLGLALVAGMALMIVRRGLAKPRKLDYARPDRGPGERQYDRARYVRGDWAFLVILVAIAVTGYLLEGVRFALDHPGYNRFSPVGWVVGQGFDGLSPGALGDVRHGLWWFHGLLAIAFVAAIPYTKAAHMLTSLASMVLRGRRPGSRLEPIPPERSAEPAGYATLSDFGLRHLVNLDACTKCGKCHDVCPAHAVGLPLSPRDVVLELREQANARMGGVGIGGVLGLLAGHGGPGNGFEEAVVGEDGVRPQTLWSCMQCNACVEICPVGIEQAPIITELRRGLVEAGEMEPALQGALQTIHKTGNSFGERARKRGRWTEELDFEVADARKQAVDVLWFVGDYASFDPRSQRVTRAVARLLHRAGVDFGILYDGERNAGNDVRRVGEEGLFESLAEQNIAVLDGCEFDRIVTSDPHSLNTLRNEYPDLGGSWPVVHHAELLLELIRAGRLVCERRLGYRVTYHDPCNLGRLNGGYDSPREILRAAGCELIEMPRNRDNSFCCGAGGGRIWMTEAPGQRERPSENRIREAVALGALDYFVVACPKDVTMYEDAIKTSGHEGRLELRELTELLEEALAPAPAPAAVA